MYDVAIIGGGVTGPALLQALARHSAIKSIVMIERRTSVAQVNSNAINNSQTLHSGEIETNFSLEKALVVRGGAALLAGYVDRFAPHARQHVSKMVIGVGESEVAFLRDRFTAFGPHFPKLRLVEREQIAALEPNVIEGRRVEEPIVALHTEKGYAVDYRLLSESFVAETKKSGKDVDYIFHSGVRSIVRRPDGAFVIVSEAGEVAARAVVVAAGPASLLFAHAMGYGREYVLLPVSGSFYRGRNLLKGKVYTVQNPKIPFAAVHGDPAVYDPSETRFGPTARPMPLLERHHYSTFFEFVRTGTLGWKGLMSLYTVTLDPDIARFALKNVVYDLPYFGKRSFLKTARKIVPNLSAGDISLDKGAGGIRGQLVDINKRILAKGADKIVGDGIIFNMAPSPGASFCLGNAELDAVTVAKFLGDERLFDREGFRKELIGDSHEVASVTVSL